MVPKQMCNDVHACMHIHKRIQVNVIECAHIYTQKYKHICVYVCVLEFIYIALCECNALRVAAQALTCSGSSSSVLDRLDEPAAWAHRWVVVKAPIQPVPHPTRGTISKWCKPNMLRLWLTKLVLSTEVTYWMSFNHLKDGWCNHT